MNLQSEYNHNPRKWPLYLSSGKQALGMSLTSTFVAQKLQYY